MYRRAALRPQGGRGKSNLSAVLEFLRQRIHPQVSREDTRHAGDDPRGLQGSAFTPCPTLWLARRRDVVNGGKPFLTLPLRRFPVVVRHDPAHEFIEQRNGKRGVAVTRTPDHAFCN